MHIARSPSCSHRRLTPHLAAPQGACSLPEVQSASLHCRQVFLKGASVRGIGLACGAEALSAASPGIDSETDWVSVGVVGPPHGIRGEMKVKPTTDFPTERLGTPGDRWLQAPSTPLLKREMNPVKMQLKKGYEGYYKGHHLWIVKLKGVDTPEEADALRGHSILIPAESRGELEEGDFYVQDLVGLRVFKKGETEVLGTICDLYDGSGGCDLLKVKMKEDEKRTFWVPFSEQLVPVVDLEGGKIEIDPVEGLLSLAEENEKQSPSTRKRRPRSRNRRRQPVPKPSEEA